MISELEVKKQETLERGAAWQKVNRDDGGSRFLACSLLPGAHAKLEPPEGQPRLRLHLLVATRSSCQTEAPEGGLVEGSRCLCGINQ